MLRQHVCLQRHRNVPSIVSRIACQIRFRSSTTRNGRAALRVEIIGVRELHRANWFIRGAAKASLTVGAETEVTQEASNPEDPLNPVWGERFYYAITPTFRAATLKFQVSTCNIFGDHAVGFCSASVESVLERLKRHRVHNQPWETFYELVPPPGRYTHGRLYVNYRVVDLDATSRSPDHKKRHLLARDFDRGNLKLPSSFEERYDGDQRPVRILALDGGGIRCVYTAVILQRLEEVFPDLLERVDVLGGVSAGGLLGLLLAAGYTPAQCQAIFEEHGDDIFSSPPTRRYSPFNARYDGEAKLDVCKKYLGERTLGDLEKYVVITAFKLDGAALASDRPTFFPRNRWRPAFFSNIPKAYGIIEPDNSMLAMDAAMATSAAPTYFPAHKGYIDGGVFANNPTMAVIAKLCAHYPGITPSHARVLSLGAGSFNNVLPPDPSNPNYDWGLRQWGPHLITMLLDSGSMHMDLTLKLSMGNAFHRIDPLLDEEITLDQPEGIPELVRQAQKADLTEAVQFIKENYYECENEFNIQNLCTGS